MAHFISGFLVLGLLSFVLYMPALAPVLVIPILTSVVIWRLRTVADPQSVHIRTVTGSRDIPWSDIKGLTFDKRAWARADLVDGTHVRLPAVTFATLPRLSAISDGRVPNPYQGVGDN